MACRSAGDSTRQSQATAISPQIHDGAQGHQARNGVIPGQVTNHSVTATDGKWFRDGEISGAAIQMQFCVGGDDRVASRGAKGGVVFDLQRSRSYIGNAGVGVASGEDAGTGAAMSEGGRPAADACLTLTENTGAAVGNRSAAGQ